MTDGGHKKMAKRIDPKSVKDCLQVLSQQQGEDDIRAEMCALLRVCGLDDIKREVTFSGAGDAGARTPGTESADVVCYSARLVVETKASGRADPEKLGARLRETQLEQLTRYLRQLVRRDPRAALPEAEAIPWRGALTDGRVWYVYEWRSTEAESEPELIRQAEFDLPASTAGAAFIEFFRQVLAPASRRGKPLPPDDLGASVLKPILQDWRKEAEQVETHPSSHYRTKFDVWKSVLDGSGTLPESHQILRIGRLYLEHSALVATARGIITALDSDTAEPDDFVHALEDGFVAWMTYSERGRILSRRLYRTLAGYDWRGTTRDVLRQAYEQLIPQEDRKEFGEYYTPDWLAAAVCEDCLDPEWLDRALVAAKRALEDKDGSEALTGIGVLDPACGSGTFLFHAARRIASYAVEQHGFTPVDACRAAAGLVHGMDIHPVAVEMSRAVLRMALPQLPPDETGRLSAYLGDALQTEEFLSGSLFADEIISIHSTQGKTIEIPRRLMRRPDFAEIVNTMVVQAVNLQAFNLSAYLLDQELVQKMKQAHETLEDIAIHEGNHIWGWKIRNVAKPLQLSVAGVDRIIGNPPWLVVNDTPDGRRKNDLAQMRAEYGLEAKGLRGASAKGDLAAVFAARVVSRYMHAPSRESPHSRRFALVVPGSALIARTWSKFREGEWASNGSVCGYAAFDPAWDLRKVRPAPFPHAPNGACVVRGMRVEKGRQKVLTKRETWKTQELTGAWGQVCGPEVDAPVRAAVASAASPYLEGFQIGTCCRPLCLCVAIEWQMRAKGVPRNSLLINRTYTSTKRPWRGRFYENIPIEREATHAFLRSQTLEAFSAQPDALLILPVFGDASEVRDLKDWPDGALPLARAWFEKADRIYAGNRAQKSAATLIRNIDWKNTGSNQFRVGQSTLTKVVYNASGGTLRAARIPADLTVNAKLYWTVLRTQREALYLTALLNAPALQEAYRDSKTSALDFDKNPLRHVPIPRFDHRKPTHMTLVQAARAAEKAAARENGEELLQRELARIDRAARRLLPRYAA